VVTYAHQAPMDQDLSGSTALKHRKTGRQTTLSLIKSGAIDRRHTRTDEKIALMEAKLRQLEGDTASSSTSTSAPAHPSLPAKPLPSLENPMASVSVRSTERRKSQSPLPLLPIKAAGPNPQPQQTSGFSPTPAVQTRAKPKLAGVKIVKQKEKQT